MEHGTTFSLPALTPTCRSRALRTGALRSGAGAGIVAIDNDGDDEKNDEDNDVA